MNACLLSWSKSAPLRIPRAFASAAVIRDCVWICGGCRIARNDDKYPTSMTSVDVSAHNSEWRKACKLVVARHSTSVTAIGSCIYILGGINSQEWGVLSKNILLMTDRNSVLTPSDTPDPVAGHTAITIPPCSPIHQHSSASWSSAIYHRLT